MFKDFKEWFVYDSAIGNFLYKIKYEVISFFDKLTSTIKYAKFIWSNAWLETDYEPLAELIRFKIQNMLDSIEYDILTKDESDKMREQMTKALLYYDAWKDNDVFVDGETEMSKDGYDRLTKLLDRKDKYKKLFFKTVSDYIENWWS